MSKKVEIYKDLLALTLIIKKEIIMDKTTEEGINAVNSIGDMAQELGLDLDSAEQPHHAYLLKCNSLDIALYLIEELEKIGAIQKDDAILMAHNRAVCDFVLETGYAEKALSLEWGANDQVAAENAYYHAAKIAGIDLDEEPHNHHTWNQAGYDEIINYTTMMLKISYKPILELTPSQRKVVFENLLELTIWNDAPKDFYAFQEIDQLAAQLGVMIEFPDEGINYYQKGKVVAA